MSHQGQCFDYDPKKSPEENTARALFSIAQSLDCVANALRDLGTADSGTRMGAVEFLAVQIRDGFSSQVSAIESLARAVNEHE